MRIAIAEFKQETNSFVPFTTTVKTFEEQYLHRGADMLTAFGDARLEIPGALDAIREAGAVAVPLLATMAMASGTVERASFEILMNEIVERLKAAGPVDGVFLALHGAMIIEDEPDAESEIVRRVREVLGPGTPITVSLDLHGHITAAMLQPDVAYIGYREFPHIDMYETGCRATRLLIDWINGKVKPVMALSKRHMVFSPDSARTTAAPLSDIVAEGAGDGSPRRGAACLAVSGPALDRHAGPGFCGPGLRRRQGGRPALRRPIGQAGMGPPRRVRA